jgi:hypothetical protein
MRHCCARHQPRLGLRQCRVTDDSNNERCQDASESDPEQLHSNAYRSQHVPSFRGGATMGRSRIGFQGLCNVVFGIVLGHIQISLAAARTAL